MTLLLNLRLQNAIIMSADKRATIFADEEQTQLKQYLDYTQKIFEWNGIGVSFHGNTATELVTNFLDKCGTRECNLTEFVDAFVQFITDKWSDKNTGFFVCGAENEELKAWYINLKESKKKQCLLGVGDYNCAGVSETFERLSSKGVVHTEQQDDGQEAKTAILDLQKGCYPLDIFGVDEAADFCRYITKATHLSQIFLRNMVTVGPYAEVLVITPQGATWNYTSIHHL